MLIDLTFDWQTRMQKPDWNEEEGGSALFAFSKSAVSETMTGMRRIPQIIVCVDMAQSYSVTLQDTWLT